MKTQTELSKATARPWALEVFRQNAEDFDSILIRAHGEQADALNEDNMTVAIMTHQRNGEANAALIVRAVNEYDALCAVAEAARILLAHHRISELRKLHSDTLDPRFAALDSALAKIRNH